MPKYDADYVTPFVCHVCGPHAYHGDTACKIASEGEACRCDG